MAGTAAEWTAHSRDGEPRMGKAGVLQQSGEHVPWSTVDRMGLPTNYVEDGAIWAAGRKGEARL